VPSSTSNSETRCPSLPYTSLWVSVIALVLFFLSTSEIYWRNKGFLPNIVDNKLYWSEHRHRVYSQHGRKKMVVVGTSRAQLGIDPTILNENFPEFDTIQLAIDGALPFEVIKDLCTDPKFDGIILADVTVPFLCVTDSINKQKELEYITYYHNTFQTAASIEKRMNASMGVFLQSNFVIFSPVLAFKSLLYTRLHPDWLYFHMQKNRFRPAFYYDRLSPEALQMHRTKRIASITQNEITRTPKSKFEHIAQKELRPLYDQLRKHGGNMVLVRMPTTDAHWEADEKMAPKAMYWDRLQILSGIPTIHFMDHENLSKFDCPDTSHLDAQDVPEFTHNLSHIVGDKLHLVTTRIHMGHTP
jgi:hypothetical protein